MTTQAAKRRKGLLVAALLLLLLAACVRATPVVYYAPVGESVQLCGNMMQSGGNLGGAAGMGSMACFSSYADKNVAFSMIALTPSFKYQVAGGYLVVNNVQATDAGFYTCSNRCDQVTYDQLGYYLHPTGNNKSSSLKRELFPAPKNLFVSINGYHFGYFRWPKMDIYIVPYMI